MAYCLILMTLLIIFIRLHHLHHLSRPIINLPLLLLLVLLEIHFGTDGRKMLNILKLILLHLSDYLLPVVAGLFFLDHRLVTIHLLFGFLDFGQFDGVLLMERG